LRKRTPLDWFVPDCTMHKKPMRLSIVIPAYNEQPRLPHTLDLLQRFFASPASAGLTLHEVIVADDGSADATAEIARSYAPALPMRVVRLPQNRGKGAASRAGMLMAEGEYALLYDADAATPIEEIVKFKKVVDEQGVPIVIGSRLGEEGVKVEMTLRRRLIGRAYHALCAPLVPGLRDTACGCKLFRIDVARKLFSLQTIDRFAFDVEVLSIAHALRYPVAEVPVRWHAVPESKVHVVRDSIQMFFCVCGLYLRRLRLAFGKADVQ
jgi:dolichyl-phosphate beta-glucosyltransferase